MSWDDDFPDEETDPSLRMNQRGPQGAPYPSSHPQHPGSHPQHFPNPPTGGFPVAQHGRPTQPSGQPVQQPVPHQGVWQGSQPQGAAPRPPHGHHPQGYGGAPHQGFSSPNTGAFPTQSGPHTGGFAAHQSGPHTGGFSQVPPQQHSPSRGGAPHQGAPHHGMPGQPQFTSMTGGHPATGSPPAPGKESFVITPRVRIMYASSGATAGALIGLFLGVVNTALEDQTLEEGMVLTFQILVWFALFIGILAAWRPDRFDNVRQRLGEAIGLNDDED